MSYSAVPYQPLSVPDEELKTVAQSVFDEMDARRSVREFSDRSVPRSIIEQAIRCASTAPSGAHMQPWTFVLVGDPEMKKQIRIAAETEERQNYDGGRIPPHWREDLAPLGTDWRKPPSTFKSSRKHSIGSTAITPSVCTWSQTYLIAVLALH